MKIAVIHGQNQERYEAAGVKPVQRKKRESRYQNSFSFLVLRRNAEGKLGIFTPGERVLGVTGLA